MATFTSRLQRITAGKASKHSDFEVILIRQLKNHSIIKASLININLLSPISAKCGNIKAFGERKKLTIIKTGIINFICVLN